MSKVQPSAHSVLMFRGTPGGQLWTQLDQLCVANRCTGVPQNSQPVCCDVCQLWWPDPGQLVSPSWKLLKRACKFMASQRSSGQRTSHLSSPPPPPPHPPIHLCTLSTPPSLLPVCGGSIYRAALATLPPSVSFTSAFPLPKGQVCSVNVALSFQPFFFLFFPLSSRVVSRFLKGQSAMLHTVTREWMSWLLWPCWHCGSAGEPWCSLAALSLSTLMRSDGNEVNCYGF